MAYAFVVDIETDRGTICRSIVVHVVSGGMMMYAEMK